jgi:hypothetical protein
MTHPSPLRSLATGAIALAAAGALLFGATPALAAENPQTTLSSTEQAPAALVPITATPDAAGQTARAADRFSNALVGGEELRGGQRIVSDTGGYSFQMQTDGNAVVYDSRGGAVWSTGTAGRGDRVLMQTDGNMVVYSARGTAIWTTQTTNEAGATLIIQGDGNLVVYRENGSPAWASRTGRVIPEPVTDTLFAGQTLRPVHQLTSANGRFRAVMQSDGNFVGYGPQGVVWAIGSTGAGNRLALQGDGNAVLYGANDSVKWNSGTRGSGLRLGVNNSGSLIIVAKDDSVLWTSQAAFPSTTLYGPNSLDAGSYLRSANGAYRAVMQADGNFVVYGRPGVPWSTRTFERGSFFAIDALGYLAVGTEDRLDWSAVPGPAFTGPFRLVMQDDGNLVEYDGRDRVVWRLR